MDFSPKSLATTLRKHLIDGILPFWVQHGLDREEGGYHAELLRDGRPGKRLRKCLAMQARMIDALAMGYSLTGAGEYLEGARHGYTFLSHVMYDAEENRWICQVRRDGTLLEERMRAFDLAAVIHGLASYARIAGDNGALALAINAYEQLDLFFWDRIHGGYFERLDTDWQVDRDTKTLDVHLHAIEALLDLSKAAPKEHYEKPLRNLLDLLIAKTQGDSYLPLFEEYASDWQETGNEPSRIKFGHLLKASRLYIEAFDRFDDLRYADFAQWQMDFVLHTGMDPAAGIYQSANALGEVLNTHEPWWAQCEAIGALASQWRIHRSPEQGRILSRLVMYCLEHFFDPIYLEWYSLIGPQGEVIDDRKAHETKGAYPIVRVLSKAAHDLDMQGTKSEGKNEPTNGRDRAAQT